MNAALIKYGSGEHHAYEVSATGYGYSGNNPAVAGVLAAMMGASHDLAPARSDYSDKVANLGNAMQSGGIQLA